MKTGLKVIKADGSCERYLYTKVMLTVSKALAGVNKSELSVTENLAEVVTYFLYGKNKDCAVPSSEILSAIKVSLTAAGYEDAAEALTRYHFQRKLKRSRVEVLNLNLKQISDIPHIFLFKDSSEEATWDKSIIIDNLVNKHGLDRQSSRTIAAMVEERAFNLNLTCIPTSLIKQLVINDTAAVLQAQAQLQTA